MAEAGANLHLHEGLTFNERPKKSRWLLLAHLVAPCVGILFLLMLRLVMGAHALFEWSDMVLFLVMCTPVFNYWVWHGLPKVVLEGDGLHVRGRLVRFDQIRSIAAQRNSTDYAVVTFGVYGAEGQLPLLAPRECSPPVFRRLLAELAGKAGVELDLGRDAPARKVRLPKQAQLADV